MDEFNFSEKEIQGFKKILMDVYQSNPSKYDDNYTALTEDFCHDERVDHDEWLDDSDHPVWDWAVDIVEENEILPDEEDDE